MKNREESRGVKSENKREDKRTGSERRTRRSVRGFKDDNDGMMIEERRREERCREER